MYVFLQYFFALLKLTALPARYKSETVIFLIWLDINSTERQVCMGSRWLAKYVSRLQACCFCCSSLQVEVASAILCCGVWADWATSMQPAQICSEFNHKPHSSAGDIFSLAGATTSTTPGPEGSRCARAARAGKLGLRAAPPGRTGLGQGWTGEHTHRQTDVQVIRSLETLSDA